MNLLSYLKPVEIARLNSTLNGEIKVVEFFGKRILMVNDAEQSGGTITGMWEKSIKKISNYQFPISNCLILGLGGGTLIEILTRNYPGICIDVVEFDPVIIEVAEKYFNIKPTAALKIFKDDAFDFIKKAKKKYDLVIFDLYLGKLNPEKSRRLPFLTDLKSLLSKSAILLFNAHYQKNELEYVRLLKESGKVFDSLELILSYPYSRILKLR